jgi:putative Ca2+/H+ antiporter (TMEM165/GDT1 family)
MAGFITVFLTVFLAELGDKTQLATVLFASDGERNRWLVFLAASGALVASTAVAILLGLAAERWLNALPLKLIAGVGFVAIGIWMIIGHIQGS